MDEAALRSITPPPEPPDFDKFWGELYASARSVEVRPEIRPARQPGVFEVEFTSLDSFRVGGWLTIPADGAVTRGVVISHGYGGRQAPEPVPIRNAAAIFPCARRISRSRHPGIPEAAAQHVLHGISRRETYVHGPCAADIWCAATALVELIPQAATRMDYIGASFGGGIGALALAADERFSTAALKVPSFGHHPHRLATPCTGSGEAVRVCYAQRPEVIDVLRYFDAATAARRIKIPMLIGAALRDPAVPPAGQFAIFNALPGPAKLFTLPTGHIGDDAEAEHDSAFHAAIERFFAA